MIIDKFVYPVKAVVPNYGPCICFQSLGLIDNLANLGILFSLKLLSIHREKLKKQSKFL